MIERATRVDDELVAAHGLIAQPSKSPEAANQRRTRLDFERRESSLDKLALALVSLVACGGNETPPAPTLAADWPAEFRAWSSEARVAAWQGAHVLYGHERFGGSLAIEVAGTTVQLYDHRTGLRAGSLLLVSPCLAKLTDGKDGAFFHYVYTLDARGELIALQGGTYAGMRAGDNAIACRAYEAYTRSNGTCTMWTLDIRGGFGEKYTPTSSPCSWSASGAFEAGDTVFEREGDALLEKIIAPREVKRSVKHPSFERAKLAAKPF